MDNYKIKVKDEIDAEESRYLFKQLGYKPDNSTFDTYVTWIAVFEDGSGSFYSSDICLDECKELTLPQLRDLVVLKRNDVKDATHTGTGDSKYYVDSNGDSYIHNSIIWTEWKLDISILKPIKKHLETATGRFDENGEHHLTFSKGSEEKDPALISGAEALRALADGKSVQWISKDFPEWDDLDIWNANTRNFLNEKCINDGGFKYRLKPQTIKVELELPKPFEPKAGEWYFFVSTENECGYSTDKFEGLERDVLQTQFGAYRTANEIEQVVEQLRKIRGAS
ncbi:hypothetical protein RKQ56_05930 [Acinetobacter baumannii]|uniref:hypothetical protein n=1 Tax=Acinetobacter baumannii TaxID=470 RepID=UPI00159D1896|nr:hypothetical protein [Acinetobacter baumannii]QLB34866.1 hypothetical protein GQO96_05905 [Acinetobacter baumannii]